MPDNNFIKNITSKDIKTSQDTILNLIKSADIKQFEKLCEAADFIFPFLKEKICANFVKLVKEEDLKTIFEFSKVYCEDFEDVIVKSWVKFANEDLTDEILELFETGSNEQKTYAAAYFRHIKDPLAIDYLNVCANSDFYPLKIASAQTLSAFSDTRLFDEMKQIALNSQDDFEKLGAFEFISAYSGKDAIQFIIDYGLDNPFKINIAASLLDFCDIESLKFLNTEDIIKIFCAILEGYPEDISLETISYYRILDFIKLINGFNCQYSKLALALAKVKFEEFSQNDIYSFDLDKNTKIELKNIFEYLKNLKLNLDDIALNPKEKDFPLALDVILEYKLKKYAPKLSGLINSSMLQNEALIKAMQVLAEFNSIILVDKNIINNIENQNIKAIVESYF